LRKKRIFFEIILSTKLLDGIEACWSITINEENDKLILFLVLRDEAGERGAAEEDRESREGRSLTQ
jgi:hypothetical protein